MSESGEKSSISETSTNDNIPIKNQLKSNETIQDGVVSRVIEVFDGEILR